jgi:hypothetical protein
MAASMLDGHRIAGEYLADPQWVVIRYSVSVGVIDLGVAGDDVASIRHAYDIAAVQRYCDVVNIPMPGGPEQIVSVSFRRPDGLFVNVNSWQTDPAVIARLRSVGKARGQRVIAALSDPAPESAVDRADDDQVGDAARLTAPFAGTVAPGGEAV